jgi:methyl-accepting chemotaxis protein
MRKSAGLEDNWNDQANYVLATTTNQDYADEMKFAASVDSVPDSGQIVGAFSEEAGHKEVRGVFPVKDAVGQRIGLVFVEHDITAVADALMNNMIQALLAVFVMLAVVLLLVVVLMNSLVFGRLKKMTTGMKLISTRISGGDYDVHYEASDSQDEIGSFEQFFEKFTSLVSSALKQLSDELAKK